MGAAVEDAAPGVDAEVWTGVGPGVGAVVWAGVGPVVGPVVGSGVGLGLGVDTGATVVGKDGNGTMVAGCVGVVGFLIPLSGASSEADPVCIETDTEMPMTRPITIAMMTFLRDQEASLRGVISATTRGGASGS